MRRVRHWGCLGFNHFSLFFFDHPISGNLGLLISLPSFACLTLQIILDRILIHLSQHSLSTSFAVFARSRHGRDTSLTGWLHRTRHNGPACCNDLYHGRDCDRRRLTAIPIDDVASRSLTDDATHSAVSASSCDSHVVYSGPTADPDHPWMAWCPWMAWPSPLK